MIDVVLVLGMHRSGTSAVAGTVSRLGCGLPKHLMSANASNARGFFESDALMNFHDELLASAGTEWSDWRPFNRGWIKSPVAGRFRQRAGALFTDEFDGSALPVLKDPRICRFTSFWLEVLRDVAATPRIAMPIRSPLDVAKSLKHLYGLSLTHGLLLWLRHVLDAESQTRSLARSIFTWSDFQRDWRGVCGRIATETHLSWPRLSDRSSREIDRFLSKDLVHHDTDHATLVAHADVHEWTLRAYEALLELAANPFAGSALAALDDVRTLLDQSSRMFGRLLIDSEIDLQEVRVREQAASSERDALRARQAENTTALSELAARAEAAATARDEIAREKDELSRTLAAAVAERAELGVAHSGVVAELQALQRDLVQKATALADLAADALAAEKARHATAREMDELSRRLAAVIADRDDLGAAHAAALAELATRAEAAETAREEIAAEKDGLTRALASALVERDALDRAHSVLVAENAAALAAFGSRLQSADIACEQAARENAALTEARRADAARLHALSGQLVDAEAALSVARAKVLRKGFAARLIPDAWKRARAAKQLLRSGLFEPDFYRTQIPASMSATLPGGRKGELAMAEHYLGEGYSQGFRPNPLFDTRWYLEQYEDVRRAGINPLLHYLEYGIREGRDPGPGFHTEYYLEANPDVRTSGFDPLAHYLRYGRQEGRPAMRPGDLD